ncbi:MAG: DUF4389 domain-containing protein [Bacteroidales bacterium]|nr:DUF4389 domain-containing protein [Bacteroidales bacterium]
MKLKVKMQESYSRLELLLRTIFGFFYIMLPHGFILFFVGIWGAILQFVAFWIVLFTGKYPQSMFEFQTGLLRWNLRLSARMYNVSDGYPSFGVNGTDEYTTLEVEYPERISRLLLLLRTFFGIFFVYLPHMFILFFRSIATGFLVFISWWIVLFTGKFPESFHNWIVGQLRWGMRISLYMQFMTDTYPAFTGDELPEEV